MVYKLSAKKIANLKKLADYLESLPFEYNHFDMSFYLASNHHSLNDVDKIRYARKNGGVASLGCGAIACAIGHGPAAGILVAPRFLEYDVVDWDDYAYFNFLPPQSSGYRQLVYDWLFESRWIMYDNHHWGAAARIRYLLAGNKITEDETVFDPTQYVKYRKQPEPIE